MVSVGILLCVEIREEPFADRSLLAWLADLSPAIHKARSWCAPTLIGGSVVPMLNVTPLAPPATFPKLGAPVRVALEELKERPFGSLNSRGGEPSGQQGSLDFASVSSSSSSSDVSLCHAAAKFLQHKTDWLAPRRLASPCLSTSSPVPSPTRRLSVEDIEKLTRATRDGRESPLPGLAPSGLPPALPHSEARLPWHQTTHVMSNRSSSAEIRSRSISGDAELLSGDEAMPGGERKPLKEKKENQPDIPLVVAQVGKHHLQELRLKSG